MTKEEFIVYVKAIKYSLRFELILFQLTSRQSGINSVVNNRKNNEIPSTPRLIFKFITGIQKSVVTN